MSSPEQQPVPAILSCVETWQAGTMLTIRMEEMGQTVMRVYSPGDQPEVDVLETVEGTTNGPLMRFLGSVANKEAIHTSGIIQGAIVRSHLLAVAVDDRPYLLTGKIDAVQVYQGKVPGPKK